MTAPPADASALAASLLRPPVSGPALRDIGLPQPAAAPASDSSADSSAGPFAALLLGFLQGAQPAALAVTASVALLDKAVGDELPVPDPLADGNGLSATLPITAAGPQPATAALSSPVTGSTLPASGSSLPLTTTGSLAEAAVATPPAAETDAGTAAPAARVSLADIEHSRELSMAIATPPQTDTWTRRFMPMSATATAGLAAPVSGTDSPTDLLPGAEPGNTLQPPAGLTAGELSRLVQNLAQNGGREPFSAALRIDGNGMNPLPGTGSPQLADTGLGSMVRGSLGGFPPLQPLGPAQAWTTGLGDRLLTLAGPGTHSARLKLHPESLGTLDIEIKIADSTAQVWFGAQHSQTREAIEASLPQLREMFAEQGIRLAHAQVDSGTDQRARNQQQAFNETDNPGNTWRSGPARGGRPESLAPARATTSRLVDAWA
ncbi:MAG: flagellar hook-length control protein FliK [Pseudomonadota bacterium]|nr:flagellar hook-length control protein FliK [Pseudomonadota bacterium]